MQEAEMVYQSIHRFENPEKEKLINEHATQDNFFINNKDHNYEIAKQKEKNREKMYNAILQKPARENDKYERYFENNYNV